MKISFQSTGLSALNYVPLPLPFAAIISHHWKLYYCYPKVLITRIKITVGPATESTPERQLMDQVLDKHTDRLLGGRKQYKMHLYRKICQLQALNITGQNFEYSTCDCIYFECDFEITKIEKIDIRSIFTVLCLSLFFRADFSCRFFFFTYSISKYRMKVAINLFEWFMRLKTNCIFINRVVVHTICHYWLVDIKMEDISSVRTQKCMFLWCTNSSHFATWFSAPLYT